MLRNGINRDEAEEESRSVFVYSSALGAPLLCVERASQTGS